MEAASDAPHGREPAGMTESTPVVMVGTKPWYLSRTVWSGIVAGIVAIYNGVAPGAGLPAIPDFVFGVLAAFGIYARVTADTVIK